MNEDQLFKDLLHAFFADFLRLFFPEVAERVDASTVTFLDAEAFTDVPSGERRVADVVAQVRTLDGAPEILLLHLEAQGRRSSGFPERMWEYFALLRLRYRVPVYPIAVYLSPGAGGITREEYRETLFGREILVYHYDVVDLPDLSAEEYLQTGNPLAYGLAALMRHQLPGPEFKLACIRGIAGSGVDEARQWLLLNVVESYTGLTDEEQAEFERRVRTVAEPEVRGTMMLYSERMKQEGMLIGKREDLLMLLRHKFGDVPESVTDHVQRLARVDEIDRLLKDVLTARSLDEMGLAPDSMH